MFTMKLEFDQDKLAKDPELDYELVMEWLDKICEDTYFIKIGTGEYKLQDDEEGEQDALKTVLED